MEHGGLLVSPETVDRRIRSSDDGFKVVLNIDVCPNGCYLFPSDDRNILTCAVSTCNRPRYNQHEEAMAVRRAGLDLNAETALSLSPVQHLSVVSICAALAQRLVNDDKLPLFNYRKSLVPFNEQEPVYRDIFDDEIFRNFVSEGSIFQNPDDVALLLFVDGFEPKHVHNHTMTIVHYLIMSIDPSNRHTADNMVTLTIAPGPSKPKDIMSLLKSIINEIVALGKKGFNVKKEMTKISSRARFIYLV
ncbi:hypothetical protein G6F56_012362 [Rhizopus delemar]|nr:hypothetical protein G6F56_012362 [Rhizopus delemar]